MKSRFKIFLSHNVQTEAATAQRIRHLLQIPCSSQGLDVEMCDNAPAGTDWRAWVRESLGKSNLLLLLLTEPAKDAWDWQFYEAGLFSSFDERSNNIVCIYPVGTDVPAPLQHLEGVEGTEEDIRRFLASFYLTRRYGCDPPLLERIDENLLSYTASQFAAALSPSKSGTTKFESNIDLHIPDAAELSPDAIPPTATVSGDLTPFGLRARTIAWKDLEISGLRKAQGQKWLSDLAAELVKARDGYIPGVVKSSFRSSNPLSSGEYLLCLQEMRVMRDRSLTFSIFMCEQPETSRLVRSISSFDEFYDELQALIESASSKDIVELLMHMPSLGYLWNAQKWDALNRCFSQNSRKLSITCLDSKSLRHWSSLFVGRQTTSGHLITKQKAEKAIAVAEELLLLVPRRIRLPWSEMPDYYTAASSDKAIAVTPFYLPRPEAKQKSSNERAWLPSVEMFGCTTKDPATVRRIRYTLAHLKPSTDSARN